MSDPSATTACPCAPRASVCPYRGLAGRQRPGPDAVGHGRGVEPGSRLDAELLQEVLPLGRDTGTHGGHGGPHTDVALGCWQPAGHPCPHSWWFQGCSLQVPRVHRAGGDMTGTQWHPCPLPVPPRGQTVPAAGCPSRAARGRSPAPAGPWPGWAPGRRCPRTWRCRSPAGHGGRHPDPHPAPPNPAPGPSLPAPTPGVPALTTGSGSSSLAPGGSSSSRRSRPWVPFRGAVPVGRGISSCKETKGGDTCPHHHLGTHPAPSRRVLVPGSPLPARR